MKTLESASTLAVSSGVDIDKPIVFTGHLTSVSEEMPVFRLVSGTSVQKVLILKGIIELEAEVGIGSGLSRTGVKMTYFAGNSS